MGTKVQLWLPARPPVGTASAPGGNRMRQSGQVLPQLTQGSAAGTASSDDLPGRCWGGSLAELSS